MPFTTKVHSLNGAHGHDPQKHGMAAPSDESDPLAWCSDVGTLVAGTHLDRARTRAERDVSLLRQVHLAVEAVVAFHATGGRAYMLHEARGDEVAAADAALAQLQVSRATLARDWLLGTDGDASDSPWLYATDDMLRVAKRALGGELRRIFPIMAVFDAIRERTGLPAVARQTVATA